jgi:hypothetical protein
MKLPPKADRWGRVRYWFARTFFPHPLDRCDVPLLAEREAAMHVRLGQHRAEQTGRPHEALIGEYNAREVLRRSAVEQFWDSAQECTPPRRMR